MHPDGPIEHEATAERGGGRGDRDEHRRERHLDRRPANLRIGGRRRDDEERHAEWAAVGFIYAIGVLSFAAARRRGVSGMHLAG